MRALALSIIFLIVLGCSGSRPPQVVMPPVIIDATCDWAGPIYVSREDVLTDETARQILSHNRSWSSICKEK